MLDRQYKWGHGFTSVDIESGNGLWQRTEDDGGHSFLPIATKWLVSGTDDDDYMGPKPFHYIVVHLGCCLLHAAIVTVTGCMQRNASGDFLVGRASFACRWTSCSYWIVTLFRLFCRAFLRGQFLECNYPSNWICIYPLIHCSMDSAPVVVQCPLTSSLVGMYRISIRYPVSAGYLTIRYYPDPVK